jgi:hypothetical protein
MWKRRNCSGAIGACVSEAKDSYYAKRINNTSEATARMIPASS